MSLTKGVAEYQLTNAFNIESNLVQTLKSMVFIFPHTLVRVVSFSLMAAFMKYYAIIPATILIIVNSVIALDVARRNEKDNSNNVLFGTFAAGFCAPFCMDPAH